MPQYLINMTRAGHEDQPIEVDGTSLASLKHEVVRMMGDMLRDSPQDVWAGDCDLRVTDNRGLLLLMVSVVAVQAAACGGG